MHYYRWNLSNQLLESKSGFRCWHIMTISLFLLIKCWQLLDLLLSSEEQHTHFSSEQKWGDLLTLRKPYLLLYTLQIIYNTLHIEVLATSSLLCLISSRQVRAILGENLLLPRAAYLNWLAFCRI